METKQVYMHVYDTRTGGSCILSAWTHILTAHWTECCSAPYVKHSSLVAFSSSVCGKMKTWRRVKKTRWHFRHHSYRSYIMAISYVRPKPEKWDTQDLPLSIQSLKCNIHSSQCLSAWCKSVLIHCVNILYSSCSSRNTHVMLLRISF